MWGFDPKTKQNVLDFSYTQIDSFTNEAHV